MNKPMELSLVIPVFNEEENILLLYEELKQTLRDIDRRYEIIFVDDGSTDNSFSELERLHSTDRSIRVFQLRRNFGKSEALSVGFKEARGKIIITLDADLQDSPKEIPKLLNGLDKYDMVVGWRTRRRDPLIKRFLSRIFNILVCFLSGLQIHDSNCGLKVMRKEVVGDMYLYGELHRYIPVMAHHMGYRVGEMHVEHHPRRFGRSKYSISRVFKGSLDLITVEFLNLYSERPLHLFGSIGILSSLLGILICIYMLLLWFSRVKIGDRPLLILGILLVLIGIQFIGFGLLGEMLIRYLKSSKKRYNIKNVLE